MTQSLLLMLAVIAATWDAWRWYLGRITSAPEEGAALGLTVLFVLALGWRERDPRRHDDVSAGQRRTTSPLGPAQPGLISLHLPAAQG